MQITFNRAASAACVTADVSAPSLDASGVVEDWQGLAAALGVSQAEVKRRAYRQFAEAVALEVALPAAKDTVLRSAEEIEAEKIKERGEKKAEKKAAKAEGK